MANNLIIDLDKWTTQQDKANNYIKQDGSKGVSIQYISKLINKGKIGSLRLDQLGIVLVAK
jgi:hypothetical protein